MIHHITIFCLIPYSFKTMTGASFVPFIIQTTTLTILVLCIMPSIGNVPLAPHILIG